MGLLEELVASARERARDREPRPPGKLARRPPFDEALRGGRASGRLRMIAEFKRKSPSRGSIGEPDLVEQVRRYESAGASAISILTEPTHFGGSYDDLARAAEAVKVPVLMKDFVVDPRQVEEAARLGASAVLLILRCLSDSEVEELVSACAAHGLTPLLECHRESEIERALSHPQAVIGVNNRDLETLQIDREIAPRLLARAPADRVVVAESGYETVRDARAVRGLADAVLVGSALMRCPDPETLDRFIGEICA